MAVPDAERTAKSRLLKEQRLAEMDNQTLEMLMYRGTHKALDAITKHAQYDLRSEGLTILIHAAYNLLQRDSHEFDKLFDLSLLRNKPELEEKPPQ